MNDALQGVTRHLLTATVLILLLAGAPHAQQPPARGDVAAAIGFTGIDAGPYGPFGGDQWKGSVYGTAAAGWYWTDHVKTEIDVGTGSRARSYHTEDPGGSRRTIAATNARSGAATSA